MRLSYHVFELSRAFTLLITQYLLRLCYYSLIYFFNGSIHRLKGSQLDDYHSVPSVAFKHHLKHVSNRPFTHSRVADLRNYGGTFIRLFRKTFHFLSLICFIISIHQCHSSNSDAHISFSHKSSTNVCWTITRFSLLSLLIARVFERSLKESFVCFSIMKFLIAE